MNKSLHKVNQDIEKQKQFLLDKYKCHTDRELFKNFSKENKEKIYDWVTFQGLFSLHEGISHVTNNSVVVGHTEFEYVLKELDRISHQIDLIEMRNSSREGLNEIRRTAFSLGELLKRINNG